MIRKSIYDYRIETYDCIKVILSFIQCLPENNKYRTWLIKNEVPPFVMVSSVKGNGENGRTYPWGVCEVWNPEHSDLQTI